MLEVLLHGRRANISLQKISWDGDLHGWPDFVRRVRWIFERTKRNRRHLLAPEIVANLTGRAWNITQDLDHRALVRRNGTIYLLEFLRERLGENPVPEELVIRLKRPSGMSMATKDVKGSPEALKSPDFKPPGTYTRTTRQPRLLQSRRLAPLRRARTRSLSALLPRRRRPRKTPSPMACRRTSTQVFVLTKGGGADARTATVIPQSKALEDLKLWDTHEVAVEDVLPTVLLGWLLLRRAGLTTQSRLAVQAAAGNSLRFEDIERCLRNMEEELTTHDDHRRGHGQRSGIMG